QTREAVAAVNRLTGQIVEMNQRFRANSGGGPDAGLDAQLHVALEQLAGLVNFSVIKTGDGAVNVYLDGQTPLVIGQHQFAIQADQSGPGTTIRDSQNNDITSQVLLGSLGALVGEKNATLPGYLTQLHQLAR